MCLPSYSEGMSRAVLEALSLGIPCVLRNVKANSELIKDKENGILFNNTTDLYVSLNKALKKKWNNDYIRLNARKCNSTAKLKLLEILKNA